MATRRVVESYDATLYIWQNKQQYKKKQEGSVSVYQSMMIYNSLRLFKNVIFSQKIPRDPPQRAAGVCLCLLRTPLRQRGAYLY